MDCVWQDPISARQHGAQAAGNFLTDILGLRLKDQIALDERVRHIRATTWLALVGGVAATCFNLQAPGMRALGLVELCAVLLFLLPAVWLSDKPDQMGVAETLMLMATVHILGASSR
jgi:hypothetical protein